MRVVYGTLTYSSTGVGVNGTRGAPGTTYVGQIAPPGSSTIDQWCRIFMSCCALIALPCVSTTIAAGVGDKTAVIVTAVVSSLPCVITVVGVAVLVLKSTTQCCDRDNTKYPRV